jgi:hypothetical protein
MAPRGSTNPNGKSNFASLVIKLQPYLTANSGPAEDQACSVLETVYHPERYKVSRTAFAMIRPSVTFILHVYRSAAVETLLRAALVAMGFYAPTGENAHSPDRI